MQKTPRTTPRATPPGDPEAARAWSRHREARKRKDAAIAACREAARLEYPTSETLDEIERDGPADKSEVLQLVAEVVAAEGEHQKGSCVRSATQRIHRRMGTVSMSSIDIGLGG